MVKADKKYIMTIIILSVIFIGLGKFIFIPVESASVPTLFINDKAWENEKTFPVEVIDGVEYVPHLIFPFLPRVEAGYDGSSFYLWNKKNNAFIAFNVNTRKAYDGNLNEIDIPVVTLNSAYYIPAAKVAGILGVEFEIDTVLHVVRIKNSSALVATLAELIAPYTEEPTTEPTVAVTEEPAVLPPPAAKITEPTVPAPSTEPTTTEDRTPRENRVAFENFIETSRIVYNENNMSDEKTAYMKSGNLSAILDILSENNYKTVFFFDSGEIGSIPEIINEIYARGHEIGIKIKNGLEDLSAYENLKDELDRANGVIYSIIKKKAQLYLLSDDFYGDGFKITLFEYSLRRHGYFLYRVNKNSSGVFGAGQTELSLDGVIRREELNTFLINVRTDRPEPIRWLFDISRQKDYIKLNGINISNLEE